ncbi:MAG: HEPN domain-containing protein [Aquificae bacterium]|nr:HEPN domain-containing protein [Aquificota bacterium]
MRGALLKIAEERMSVARHAFSQELYSACACELYFALFTLMRSVLTESYRGRWKHLGIFTEFSKLCIEEGIIPKNLLKEVGQVNQDLYYMRRKVDYGEGLDTFDIEALRDYLPLVEEVFKVVKDRVDFGGS